MYFPSSSIAALWVYNFFFAKYNVAWLSKRKWALICGILGYIYPWPTIKIALYASSVASHAIQTNKIISRIF
jgi:hypothetical protein